jgi:hypothetical protein
VGLGGHLKTGQSWTGQNRPVGAPPQARVFYRVHCRSSKRRNVRKRSDSSEAASASCAPTREDVGARRGKETLRQLLARNLDGARHVSLERRDAPVLTRLVGRHL